MEPIFFLRDENVREQYIRLYSLAYKLVPFIINECNENGLSHAALFDRNFWKEVVQNNDPENIEKYGWDEIKIIVIKKEVKFLYIIQNKYYMTVIQFPNPFSPVLAKYGAAIIDGKMDKIVNYFTLEKSYSDNSGSDNWVIGSMDSNGTHINYGELWEAPTMENYVKAVSELVKIDFLTPLNREILGHVF